MTLLRRFLVLAALMFWQGGFTFYAAVVVPVGQQVLPTPMDQARVTRQVTNYLNLAGGVSLLLLAWDAAVSGDPSRRRRWLRWLAWASMVLALGLLVWLHVYLDEWLDAAAAAARDPHTFRILHRCYLWISTMQWAGGVVYALLALRAWRVEDGNSTLPVIPLSRIEHG
jgi:hypothetical protein